jgi:hypothetical protein
MPQLAFHQHPFGISSSAGQMSWPEMIDAQHGVAHSIESAIAGAGIAVHSLRDLLRRIQFAPVDPSLSSDKQMRDLMHRVAGDIETVKGYAETSIIPQLKDWDGVIKQNSQLFDRAYDPDVMDRQLGTLAAIETQIDKAEARIVRLKEYHHLEASRSPIPLPAPSPSIIPAPAGDGVQSAEKAVTRKKKKSRSATPRRLRIGAR